MGGGVLRTQVDDDLVGLDALPIPAGFAFERGVDGIVVLLDPALGIEPGWKLKIILQRGAVFRA